MFQFNCQKNLKLFLFVNTPIIPPLDIVALKLLPQRYEKGKFKGTKGSETNDTFLKLRAPILFQAPNVYTFGKNKKEKNFQPSKLQCCSKRRTSPQ